jgi:hypothetical protein
MERYEMGVPKAVVCEQFARIGRALSNPARLELLPIATEDAVA